MDLTDVDRDERLSTATVDGAIAHLDTLRATRILRFGRRGCAVAHGHAERTEVRALAQILLRESSAHPIVSGPKPSPLFWFTTSRLFELGPDKAQHHLYEKRKDFFLAHPEIIFHGVWATPVATKPNTRRNTI